MNVSSYIFYSKSDTDGPALCITYFFHPQNVCVGSGVLGCKRISHEGIITEKKG